MSRVRDDAAIRAIDEQIEFFQNRLADQNLVTQNKRVFESVAAVDFDDDWLSDPDQLFASVRELGRGLLANPQTDLFYDVRRNHRPNRAGVHESIAMMKSHFRTGRWVAPV